jgi:NAD(P) transhydrogenase subunit beta
MLSSPTTARRGNLLSAIGMLLAVIVTLLHRDSLDFRWIMVGLIIGTIVGALAARLVAMTAMPGMVGLLNGSGGLASLLVAWEAYHRDRAPDVFTAATIVLSIVIGGVAFTGSVLAWAKLAERITGRPILFSGQQIVNGLLLAATIAGGVVYCLNPEANYPVFIGLLVLALLLGITSVLPIGGADMPVVISLLNSYGLFCGILYVQILDAIQYPSDLEHEYDL